MKPIDFYSMGLKIAQEATSEAECRSAVGRIYYGLHHEACCRYFRENSGLAHLPRKGSRHMELVNSYRGSKKSGTARYVGSLLDQLRYLRTIADYDLAAMSYNGGPITGAGLLKEAMEVGEELLEALNKYSPGQAPDGCRCVFR